MKNILSSLLLLVLLAMALPVSAQFRRDRNTANKEYELHAYNLAIENYKKALERRPDDLESLSRIADSYRMLNQMQTAHGYYQKAVLEKKVEGKTVLEHAHVLKALGRYDEAKQFYLLYARDFDVVMGNHFAQSCDFAKTQVGVDAGFTAQSISTNSPSSEFGATVPSPQQLVFNSARTMDGQGFTGQASNMPYVSSVGADGGLQKAFVLQNGYKATAGNVGPVSYTPDGRQVIFTQNNFTAGTRMIPEAGITMTLYIADVNDQGLWLNIQPLPFNGTAYNTGYGSFSADGQAIYFSSDRPEGYGGYDIYRAQRSGGTWSAVPENLGTVVNSIGHEITPFYDGQSLYFSSNHHQGLGTYDVFRAEMGNSRPVTLYHMGEGINSSRDDIGFVIDPVTAVGYVSSNRIGGSGMEDIYRIGLKTNNKTLVVQSERDGSYIANAAVDFTSCGGQVYATDAQGRYVFEPAQGLNCDVVISKPGFTTVRMPFSSFMTGGDNNVRVALKSATGITGSTVVGGGGTPQRDTNTPIPGGPTPPGTYRGMVTNAQTGYPIPMANIRVTQRSTGASANVFTNVDGAYILALMPNTAYDLSISAEGFTGVQFPVSNGNGSDANILGNTTLLPGADRPGSTTGTTTTTTNPGGYTPPTTTVTTGGVTTTSLSGYSVQLASLRSRPDLSKFSNVSSLGRVYDVDTGSSYKVRLGVYASRAEAEAAAAGAKSAGYNGAFVVADSGVSNSGTTTSTGTTSTPTTSTPTTTTAGVASKYKVQLGAYGQPQNFDRSRAAQLGVLETRQRGTLTLFLIGGLNTLSEAATIKARARSLGYEGAFVLEDVGGELKKVQ